MKNEAFLPKKAFAGSNKHKLGTKGQARGEPGRSQKPPLTGLMVGEERVDEISDELARSAAKGRWNKTTSAVDSAKELQTKGSVNKAKKEIEKAKRHKELQAQRSARLSSVNESVIIGPDEDGDWTNPQVQILGGGGSYTLDRLYNKAKGEAAEIKELIDAGEHKKAAFYLKQFKNTLDTIVAAKDELSKRHFGEAKQRLDPKCWKGYRRQGTKMKDGVRVNNCVKVGEAWDRKISKLIKILESK